MERAKAAANDAWKDDSGEEEDAGGESGDGEEDGAEEGNNEEAEEEAPPEQQEQQTRTEEAEEAGLGGSGHHTEQQEAARAGPSTQRPSDITRLRHTALKAVAGLSKQARPATKTARSVEQSSDDFQPTQAKKPRTNAPANRSCRRRAKAKPIGAL